jgi:hypothetical protein
VPHSCAHARALVAVPPFPVRARGRFRGRL